MSALPLRVRVAGAFAVVLALVLVAAGAFLHARLAADLTRALDDDLRLRAGDVAALVEREDGALARARGVGLVEPEERFAQVLDADGRIVDGTPLHLAVPLLDDTERRAALEQARYVDRPQVAGLDEPARLLAVPLDLSGRHAVLVVGATAENRAEALRDLRRALLVAGPLALLVATAAGYRLAGVGLAAVDAMRRRAAAISDDLRGERLPVPPSRDELARLGTTLNGMLDRLERALERERALVADAGHELRTPIALARAELDFALHQAVDERERREALVRASDETDRLALLAADLLLLAERDRGRLALHPEDVDVGELCRSVANRFAWRAGAAGRPIETSVPDGLDVTGDRLRLEQALGNLVDNGLRHGAGTVTLAARLRGSSVELRVEDEGPGIPAAFAPAAFERFRRADAARGGAGLGLAIVRAIAEAHGGAAELEPSHRGCGVVVRLPRGPLAPLALPVSSST